MSILTQLGVNQTFFIQLAFFFISYFFVSQFLIKPYRRNLEYRKKNTGGSVDEAAHLNLETERLVGEYQQKAKAQNESAQGIYEKFRAEGQQEEERIISVARKQSQDAIEQTKKKISQELSTARESLRNQVPQLSELIASRVLGRKLS